MGTFAVTTETARAQAAQREEAAARRRAETIRDFVVSALRAGDASQPGGRADATILDAMDDAIADVDSPRFRDDLATAADLKLTIAAVLRVNGRLSAASTQAGQALELLRRVHSRDHDDIAAAWNGVAWLHDCFGRPVEALPPLADSLVIYRPVVPGDDASVALCLDNLAATKAALSDLPEACGLQPQAVDMLRRVRGGDHPDLAVCLNNLAVLWANTGENERAETMLEEALAMLQRLPEGRAALRKVLWDSARHRLALGDAIGALPELEQLVQMASEALAADSPWLKRYRAALAKCRKALPVKDR